MEYDLEGEIELGEDAGKGWYFMLNVFVFSVMCLVGSVVFVGIALGFCFCVLVCILMLCEASQPSNGLMRNTWTSISSLNSPTV